MFQLIRNMMRPVFNNPKLQVDEKGEKAEKLKNPLFVLKNIVFNCNTCVSKYQIEDTLQTKY